MRQGGWNKFIIRAPGKWVLSGEHAVLRGATAVAFPHPEFCLTLEFEPASEFASKGDGEGSGLEIQPEWARSVILDLLQMVRDEQNARGREFQFPAGRLMLESTVPSGAGLGSSAALCVAVARWLSEPLGVPDAGILEFATHLEHRFHGKSSGMDVAVCAVERPISFVRGRGPTFLQLKRFPKFTFHDTGLRASTSECIRRVEQLREDDPVSAIRADELMSRASRFVLEGLPAYDGASGQPASETALKRVAEGMKSAHEAFLIWSLVPGKVQREIEDLYRQGALAVKLTGAGGGGFLVALWP
jgi:mevalonate kinase